MEVVYDLLGRTVGSRYVGETGWQCTNYDTRGRVTTVTIPAYGTAAARTKTNAYMVGGDPSVTTTADGSVAGSTNGSTITTKTDFLGRALEITDVWGITTTTVFDVAGRAISSSSPGGVIASTYDDAGRLLTQTLDGQPVATQTYTPVTPTGDSLDGGSLNSITYPTGGGNGTSLAPITRDQFGRTTSLDWRQANGTALTKDTVTRALSARVLTDAIDGTSAWSYNYDAAGRLTAAAGSGHNYAYGYNSAAACSTVTGNQTAAGANANRTTVTDNGANVSSACYDQADRLLATTQATGYTTGGTSVSVTYSAAGAGMGFLKTGTPITPVAGQGISFWAYGAVGGNTIDVQTLTPADVFSTKKTLSIPAGVWTQFFVSWADLGNPTSAYRVHFLNSLTTAQSTFWIDDIQIASSPAVVIYDNAIATGWEDRAWSTSLNLTVASPAHTAAATTTTTYAYDSHGNTTSMAGQTLGYDYDNRHITTTAGTTTIGYTRDVLDWKDSVIPDS